MLDLAEATPEPERSVQPRGILSQKSAKKSPAPTIPAVKVVKPTFGARVASSPFMPQHFVLLIQEPSLSLQRAVQIHGLPFTIGSGPEAQVCLRTPDIPTAWVEAADDGYRVVNGSSEEPIGHGSTFELGGVSLRFFVGTAESLRSHSTPKPEELKQPDDPVRRAAVAYLERLAELERKLAGVKLKGDRPLSVV